MELEKKLSFQYNPITDSELQMTDQTSKVTLGEGADAKAPLGCTESPILTCTQTVGRMEGHRHTVHPTENQIE